MGNLNVNVKTKKNKMSARVYRVATGKWEDLGVISKSKESIIRRMLKWLF
jgi:hypothetical protein